MGKLKNIFKELKFMLQLTGVLAGITALVSAGVLYFGKDYFDKARVSEFFPESVDLQYHFSPEERDSLEFILNNKVPSPDVGETNVCGFVNLRDFSYGCCTFLSKEWVLLSYHELLYTESTQPTNSSEYETINYFSISTNSDMIHSITLEEDNSLKTHMKLVCASPRQDLALIKVIHPYDYIGTVALPESVPEVQEGLTYFYFRGITQSPPFSKKEVPPATMTSHNVIPSEFAQFSYEAKAGEFSFGVGTSGGPIYQGDVLRGIIIRGGNEPGTAMYSPDIRGFIERCLKEQ